MGLTPERLQQLKDEADSRTDDEEQLVHSVYSHVDLGAAEINVAIRELEHCEDERIVAFRDYLLSMSEALYSEALKVLKNIPGLLTVEETKQLLNERKAVDNLADFLLMQDEDPDILH